MCCIDADYDEHSIHIERKSYWCAFVWVFTVASICLVICGSIYGAELAEINKIVAITNCTVTGRTPYIRNGDIFYTYTVVYIYKIVPVTDVVSSYLDFSIGEAITCYYDPLQQSALFNHHQKTYLEPTNEMHTYLKTAMIAMYVFVGITTVSLFIPICGERCMHYYARKLNIRRQSRLHESVPSVYPQILITDLNIDATNCIDLNNNNNGVV